MKPIDKLEFWKDRIDRASGEREHHSVYVTTPADWAAIGVAHRAILEKLVSGKVLDAGCGYGRVSEWVDDYTGVDFSPDFVALARAKYPGKRFEVANLKALPFADGEFDWAVAVSIKDMVVGQMGEGEWGLMQAELSRVAKKVLLLEYTRPEAYIVI